MSVDTATAAAWDADVRPGMVGWDEGSGVVGWMVRLTGPAAHCFVFVERLAPGVWLTAEAYPNARPSLDGFHYRTRTVAPLCYADVCPDEDARSALLAETAARIGTRYDWAAAVSVPLARLGFSGWARRLRLGSRRRGICSQVTWAAVCAAVPAARELAECDGLRAEVTPSDLLVLVLRLYAPAGQMANAAPRYQRV